MATTSATNHEFSIELPIGTVTTWLCKHCADWVGCCFNRECVPVTCAAWDAKADAWIEQIRRGQTIAPPAPPPPREPGHKFTINRGPLVFCDVCAVEASEVVDDRHERCRPRPVKVQDDIERRITRLTLHANIDWREDQDHARHVRLARGPAWGNVSAAVNNIVGGWNRRAP